MDPVEIQPSTHSFMELAEDSRSTDPDVLVHHSVSAIFGTSFCRQLESQLDSSLPPDIEIAVARTAEQSRQKIHETEAVLTIRPVSDTLTDSADLQWVQTVNAGLDSYDLNRLDDLGIVVTNASGVAANPIAEQVLGYMLVFGRRIHKGIRQQERQGVWHRYSGSELAGKTVGIIGVGAIGTRVAELASGFDMEVIGTKKNPETAPDVIDEIAPPRDLSRILARSDYVVVACPLVEETRGLIGEKELMAMKSDVVLVNVARGEIVDEQALETALQKNRIRGTALDVFEEEPLPQESPLWDLSNVVITPHMAGSTPQYAERICSLFTENYRYYTEGNLSALRNRVV